MAELRTRWDAFRALLPAGLMLPERTWEARHRFVLWVLALHAVLLPVFGLLQTHTRWPLWMCLLEGAIVGALALLAAPRHFGRRFRSSMAALGAVTSSAILVQFSGGYIEAHFHYFIVVAMIALYQDWVPFLLAILFVGLSHGVLGVIQPHWVYNHHGAITDPWTWATIHAVFVWGECVALLAFWSGAEQARERGDLLIAAAGEGILGLDTDGKVTFANPVATRMLAQPERDIVGRGVGDYLKPAAGAFTLAPAPVPTEGHVVTARDPVPAEWIVAPMERHGLVVGHVAIVRDITARKRAEEDRRKVEVLTERDRFKSQLLNIASHELNTPIAILWYQLHWMRSRLATNPDRDLQKAVATLEENLRRLSTLVRDTLDVARLDNGRMQLRLERVDLAVLAESACRDLAPLARDRNVRITTDLASAVAVADGGRIAQVMFNLVGNAVKFTRPGTEVQVRVRAGAMVRFEVQDQGPGIPKEKSDNLFQAFSQLEQPETKELHMTVLEGTGLGLHISKGIVELHGGTIGCDSEPGKGSLFHFELPLVTVVERSGEGAANRVEEGLRAQ